MLTIAQRTNMQFFAQDHIGWQLDQWHTVMFTDESHFHVSTCDRLVRAWRRVGERYTDCNIAEHDRFDGGSVMFWCGICYDGRTEMYRVNGGSITALRYIDKILDPIIRPFLGAMGDNAFWYKIMSDLILLMWYWATLNRNLKRLSTDQPGHRTFIV